MKLFGWAAETGATFGVSPAWSLQRSFLHLAGIVVRNGAPEGAQDR